MHHARGRGGGAEINELKKKTLLKRTTSEQDGDERNEDPAAR